jgi:integrase/recombinase XerD
VLYSYQLRRWFEWCEGNGLDPLVGIQRAHVELYIRGLGEAGLMASSTNTMMRGVRGFFRFAHIDGLIPADPAVYARLPKVHCDESRTQGLDRLELIRFLQVAQTVKRPSRRSVLPVGHQRAASLGGGRGPNRGPRRDPAGPPGPASGR